MRKLRIFEHISLDGVIQISAPGENNDFPYGDWTAPYRSPEGRDLVLSMYGERYDLLLGRRTYDLWSGYWPKAPASPMADRINAATKYIATHRPESLSWGPVKAVGPDIAADIHRIKAEDGPDIILAGSSSLTSTLLEHNLADELILITSPVLLGKGKRLFTENTPPRSFEHASSTALPSGIVVSVYKVGGGLRNEVSVGTYA